VAEVAAAVTAVTAAAAAAAAVQVQIMLPSWLSTQGGIIS
jgi:hypothetical protein